MCNQSAAPVVMLLTLCAPWTLFTLTRTMYTVCIPDNIDYAALWHSQDEKKLSLAPRSLDLRGIRSITSATGALIAK